MSEEFVGPLTGWATAKGTFGAQGQAIRASGGITAGSNVLTIATPSFLAGMVGRRISVFGAGSGGAKLVTTVAGFTSTTVVTLTVNATTTVAAARVVCGNDDQGNLQAMANALAAGTYKVGMLDAGYYVVTSGIYLQFGQYLALLGEDPATTGIIWDGPYLQYMAVLNLDANHYSRFGRFEIDGGNDATYGHVEDASCTNGSTTLTSNSNPWTAAVVGKRLLLRGGGSGGGDMTTTVAAFVSAGQITLTAAAQATTSNNAQAIWGMGAWACLREDGSGSQGFFPTGSEYVDMDLHGADHGIRAGTFGVGVAEHMVKRTVLHHNTLNGMLTGNANDLDWWFWDCHLHDNSVGLGNHDGWQSAAGNFHGYRSIFENHSRSDVLIGNTEYHSFRESSFRNSRRAYDSFGIGAACPTTFHRCTILDTTDQVSLSGANGGPMFFVDNVGRSLPGVTQWFAGSPTMVAGGNTLGTSSFGAVGTRALTFDPDVVTDRANVNPSFPVFAGHAPKQVRTVYEVPPGSTRAAIQTAINSAVATGNRAVVHLQGAASYNIDQTLDVAASNIQITGDGAQTILNWVGANGQPVILLRSPSQVTVRDLGINGNNRAANGVEIESPDQVGGKVLVDQHHCATSVQAVLADRLNNCQVEVRGSQATSGLYGSDAYHARAATLVLWGCALGANDHCYGVSYGGRVLNLDTWYEGEGAEVSRLEGRGNFAHWTGKFAPNKPHVPPAPAGTAAVAVNGHRGRVTLLGGPLVPASAIHRWASRHDAPLLALGTTGNDQPYYTDNETDSRGAMLLAYRVSQAGAPDEPTYSPGSAVTISDQRTLISAAQDAAFVKEQMAELRAVRSLDVSSPVAGVTQVELYKLDMNSVAIGVWVRGSTASLGSAPASADAYTKRVIWLVADAQVSTFVSHLRFIDTIGQYVSDPTDFGSTRLIPLFTVGVPGTRTHRWCCLQMTDPDYEDLTARLASQITAGTVKVYLTENPGDILTTNNLDRM